MTETNRGDRNPNNPRIQYQEKPPIEKIDIDRTLEWITVEPGVVDNFLDPKITEQKFSDQISVFQKNNGRTIVDESMVLAGVKIVFLISQKECSDEVKLKGLEIIKSFPDEGRMFKECLIYRCLTKLKYPDKSEESLNKEMLSFSSYRRPSFNEIVLNDPFYQKSLKKNEN